MAGRRLILGLMLLLHTAFSLLGSAGTHVVLGCQHDHGLGQTCASHADHSHSHTCCRHAHQHVHEHAPQPEERAPAPLTDDDCAICQLFTCPSQTTVIFHWESAEVQAECLVAAPDSHRCFSFESGYEVRGPPVEA